MTSATSMRNNANNYDHLAKRWYNAMTKRISGQLVSFHQHAHPIQPNVWSIFICFFFGFVLYFSLSRWWGSENCTCLFEIPIAERRMLGTSRSCWGLFDLIKYFHSFLNSLRNWMHFFLSNIYIRTLFLIFHFLKSPFFCGQFDFRKKHLVLTKKHRFLWKYCFNLQKSLKKSIKIVWNINLNFKMQFNFYECSTFLCI